MDIGRFGVFEGVRDKIQGYLGGVAGAWLEVGPGVNKVLGTILWGIWKGG